MQKISVIIPIYNTEEFLEQCINSIVNQTYLNLEILLINDGSSQECKSAIEKFTMQDERIITYHFEEKKGVGAARNYGLKKATGKYVYFLDSDDYLQHNTLELLINKIGKYPVLAGEIISTTKKDSDQVTKQNIQLTVKLIKEVEQFTFMSTLHLLVSRDFLIAHQLCFSEDVQCYSDIEFLLPFLIEMKELPVLTGCFYYKRSRNDPISNPSLLQMEGNQKITDFLKIFNRLKEKYSDDRNAAQYLDHLLLYFYQNVLVLFFIDEEKIQEIFDQLSLSVQKVEPTIIRNTNFLIRREFKWLIAGKEEKFTKLIKNHHNIKKIRWALQGRTKFFIQLYRSVFSRLPLKENTIIFESFLGKNYSDSPKYMYEYMLNKNMDYQYIWIFNKIGKNIPGNAKQVKRFSLAYYYYLATSKYWVSNSRMPLHLNKRKGNIYIQTWHGTPLKKLVFDMNEIHSANPNYKKNFFQQSRRWDYLVSPNQYSSDIFRRAFKYEKEMLEYGYPRNDILYNENREELAMSIKQKLGIPADKKVILYAPTWRDDEFYESGKYKFNLKLDLQEMKEKLSDEYVIILRMHYFIADNIELGDASDFAYNLSKYDDIAELYLISDLLITDYSSVFFDYANLQRPILFYTYDLEKYRDTLRGFYIDIEKEVPGPLLNTSDEVIQAILQVDKIREEYKDRYREFYKRFCDWDNGKASEKITNKIFNQ